VSDLGARISRLIGQLQLQLRGAPASAASGANSPDLITFFYYFF
jgi:hypothetical protein